VYGLSQQNGLSSCVFGALQGATLLKLLLAIVVLNAALIGALQGATLLKLLLAIEPVVVLNAALCERALRHCPASHQLISACQEVRFLQSPVTTSPCPAGCWYCMHGQHARA
jgi:hypothetical protein